MMVADFSLGDAMAFVFFCTFDQEATAPTV